MCQRTWGIYLSVTTRVIEFCHYLSSEQSGGKHERYRPYGNGFACATWAYVWSGTGLLSRGDWQLLLPRFEPVTPLYLGAGICGGMGLLFAKRFGEVLSPIVIGICLVGIGFSIAALRTHSLEAPVLGWRYYRAIEDVWLAWIAAHQMRCA